MHAPLSRSPVSTSSSGYEDGLGRRVLAFDRATGGMLERLYLRPEFSAFESALREVVARATTASDDRIAAPLGLERDELSRELVLVSPLAGERLGDLLDVPAGETRDEAASPGIDVALGFLVESLSALEALRVETGLSHGAVSPSRVVFSPAGRLRLVECVFGPVLQRLNMNRRRLWTDFRILTPPVAGASRFDATHDIGQSAVLALMFVLGRTFEESDAENLPDLLVEAIEIAQIRGSVSFAVGFQRFLQRALPLPGRRPYQTLDAALADVRAVASQVGLEPCLEALAVFGRQTGGAQQTFAPMDDFASFVPAIEFPIAAGPEIAAEPIEALPSVASFEPPIEALPPVSSFEAAVEALRVASFEPAVEAIPVASFDPAFESAPEPEAIVEAEIIAAVEPAASAAPAPAAEPAQEPEQEPAVAAAPLPEPAPATSRRRRSRNAPTHEGDTLRSAATPPIVERAPAVEPEPPVEPVRSLEPVVVEPVAAAPPPVVEPIAAVPPPIVEPVAAAAPPVLVPVAAAPPPVVEPVRDAMPKPIRVVVPPPPVIPQPVFTPIAVLSPTSVSPYTAPTVAVASPAPLSPPAALPQPAPLRLKADPPPGYAPPRPRYEAPRHEGTRFEPARPKSGGPSWKMGAAAAIVLAAGAFAARSYLPTRTPSAGSKTAAASVGATATVAATTGTIEAQTQPAGARVLLDGDAVGETPVKIGAVSPGRHVLTFITATATVKRTVRVEAGKTLAIDVPVFSGWVAVFAPIVLEISEGGTGLGTTERGRLLLPPGRHTLTFTNRDLNYSASQVVDITPGEVRSINIEPRGTVSLNALPWAEVWIDGKKAGDTPVANLQIPLGSHEIVFKHPQFGERRMTTRVTGGAPSAISVDFSKPQ
jgi:hypothetical protein